jgi:hypothetical protein
MNPIFEITSSHIEELEKRDFLILMNKLLWIESTRKIGISPANISISLRENDPDEGIDAQIKNNTKIHSDWIPMQESVWQFKTGRNIDKSLLEKEFEKKGVQKCIKDGGTYIVIAKRDFNPSDRDKRKKILEECFIKRGLQPKCEFLTSSHIAMWASEYPTEFLRFFNIPIKELITFDKWSREKVHRFDYYPDKKRDDYIRKIRESVQIKDRLITIHIEGLAGVGKTRLILETLRTEKLKDLVLYAAYPETISDLFFYYIDHNPNIELILVIDECDEKSRERWKKHVEHLNGRIKLITISQSRRPPYGIAGPEGVYYLDTLDDDIIKKIITNIYPFIQKEAINTITHLSEGYVKLVKAITETFRRNPDLIRTSDLAYEDNVNKILRALIPSDKLDGMKAISLLTKVGWEGDISTEGKKLAKFMNINWGILQDIAEEMYSSGLISKQGRYRYVTPYILAIWLASEVWKARGTDMIDLLKHLPTPSSRKAFLERIADLGDNDHTLKVVEKLLSEKGLFPDLESIDSEEKSEIFTILTEASPISGIEALKRILINLPRDRLILFKKGRRNIIWTLEKLAWLPETFFDSARILLSLAEAENESWANNATGIWCGLFSIHLGGTAVPALERHQIIDDALKSESIERKILGVNAIDAALSTSGTRMVGPEIQRGRIVPQEWYPKTYKEEIDIRLSALNLLDIALKDENARVFNEALNVLINNSIPLISIGIIDEILYRFELLNLTTDKQKFDVRNVLERIPTIPKSKLSEEQIKRIDRLLINLAGDDFKDRLRRWIGRRTYADSASKNFKNVEKAMNELAKEALENPEKLLNEIGFLASDDAIYLQPFGVALGIADRQKKLLYKFIEIAKNYKVYRLLSGYLLGISYLSKKEEEWRENLLDKWAENEPDLAEAVLDATWRGPTSIRGAKRLINMVKNNSLNDIHLRILTVGAWTDHLPLDLRIEIINQLIETNEPSAIESALVMVERCITIHSDEKNQISSIAWKLIECPIAITSGVDLSYHWAQIAEHFIDIDPLKIAKAIIKNTTGTDRIFLKDDFEIEILKKVTEKKPKQVWDEVSKFLITKDGKINFNLILILRGWYGNLIDADYLIKWASKHPQKGPLILAEISKVGNGKLSNLARSLIIEFPDNEEVKHSLEANFFSGSYTGLESKWLEEKLKYTRAWMENSNPKVRKWAQEIAQRIEKRIKKIKIIEEERGW